MSQTIFITGTGTDVGKTYVTSLLIRQLRAQGLRVRVIKPIISGFDPDDVAGSDCGRLLQAMGEPPTLDRAAALAPWRYSDPIPPHLAAAQAGDQITLAAVLDFCQQQQAAGDHDYLLIEGAGGIMVPINPHQTLLDLMVALDCQPLLVAGSYLGTLSHSLSALACLDQVRRHPVGMILSQSPESYADFDVVCQDFKALMPHVTQKYLPRHSGKQVDITTLLHP